MKKNYILFTVLLFVNFIKVDAQLANWSQTSGSTFPTNLVGQINGMTRISQLKHHPTDSMKMYAVTAEGGFFVTTNKGTTWSVKSGTENLTGSCASLCIDYTNDQNIFLGTGDANYYSNGSGILKSTDGGTTFNATSLTNCLVVHMIQNPLNSSQFIAATNKGIYKSTNSGANWTAKTSTTLQFVDMRMNPGTGSKTLYACTKDNNPRLYKSTDFGDNWTELLPGFTYAVNYTTGGARIGLTPADTNIVYYEMIGGGGIVYLSTNGGNTFRLKKAEGGTYINWYSGTGISGTLTGQGNYNNAIWLDRTNPAKIWLQSHNTWLSTDTGATWTQLTQWASNVHTDMHQLETAPFNNNLLISCNDGGIWFSTNGGTIWTPKCSGIGAFEIGNNAGISAMTNKDFVSIGTQDNARLYGNASGWFTISGGDDYAKRVADFNGFIYYDGTNRQANLSGSSTTYGLPTANWNTFGFNRTNINLGFMGEQDVWRTTNLSAATPTWTQISSFNSAIRSVHSCIADPNTLYVLLNTGNIYVSTNALSASPTFTLYTVGGSASSTGSVVAMANNATIVYVQENNKVYRSANSGQTWTNITYNLASVNHRRILAEQFGGTNELVFIATNNAVYYKKAGQTTWTNYSTNLPGRRSPVEFSMYDDGTNNAKIRYATYGRSMWETRIGNLREVSASFDAAQTFYCTSGTAVQFRDQSLGNITSWSWSFPGGSPSTSTSQNPSVTYSTGGVYSATLTVSDGTTTSKITIPNYILILSSSPKANTGCTLASNSNLNNGFGIGIFYFGLGTITNSTSGSDGYYNDYSCSQYTYLTPGNTYNATITTGTTNAEGAQVYIDWNDDGNLQSTEAVISFPANNSGSRTLSFTVPTTGVVLNKGLRLRVVSRFNSIPTSACNTSTYGQAEDYTVYVQPVTSAVLANGTGSSSICTGSSANLKITITGGTSPYSVVISNGTTTQTINSYTSGANINVTPSSTTNYSIVSVMDNVFYSLTTSGAPSVTVSPNVTWYLDGDGDGYYVNTQSNCVSPGIGWNTIGGTNGDCNDNIATMHQQFPFYVDADGDGFGTGSLTQVCAVGASLPPTNYSLSNIDCNDNNAAIHSPVQYFLDVDGDGYGSTNSNFLCSTTVPVGYSSNNTDCNDNNINMHQQFSFYIDNDGDGFGSTTTAMVCAVNSNTAPTGYSVNALDCNDNNASLTTGNSFYVDADGDGFGSTTTAILCSTIATAGYSSNNTDCNDNNVAIHIGNTFYIDNDGDGFGSTTSVILCNISAPAGYSANNTDCNDNNISVHSATLIPTVSISVVPSNIVTQGTSVTFTATTTNGGTSPIYQWQKNGNLVGTNSNTYATTPVNADSIWCVINSNAQCIATSNATSSKIKMIVTPVSTGGGGSNDFPCGALNASANSGSIAGLPTVLSAYDDGGSVYGGLTNSSVLSSPPSGPSLVYFTGNNSSATSSNDPIPSCVSYASGYVPKTVWYKFRVPTFAAGVTLRSVISYGQSFNAVLAVYKITSGTACSLPVFSEIQCSSTGTLALTQADLISYQGQYLYVQLQGTNTNPAGIYTLSIQGIVPNISLSAPTSTTIQVNFPSISAPNLKLYVYWQRVGTNGATYIGINPTNSYTINGLISGQNYKVWVKFVDVSVLHGSVIYCEAKTLGTTSGCGSVLPAPTITSVPSHCARVYFNFTNPPTSVPSLLVPPPSTFPIRLIWALNGTNRGWVQALATIPSGGYFINNLILNSNYSFYYSYKCIGGAVMNSYLTNYSSCIGPARLNKHHEYVINGVHYIDNDLEDLMAAAMPENIDDGNIHEITFDEIEYKNDESMPTSTDKLFSVSPIPADQEVELKFNSIIKNGWIKMVDLSGKTIFTKEITESNFEQKINIAVSQLESGIYLIQFIDENNFESQKIIISR